MFKFKLKKDQFLFFLMVCFVFLVSIVLVLYKDDEFVKKGVESVFAGSDKTYPPIPVLSESANFPVVSGQAVIAIDLTSGITLYEKNPDLVLLPASTTKIITALVALDTYPLDSVITVGRVGVVGQKMGLYTGEEMKAEDVLYGLLVYSANDAAEALAQAYPGGRDAFISAMNDKAKELSMKNTYFINPTGLDGNSATAKDLLRASEVAMRNPVFAKIVSTENVTVKDVTGKNVYRLRNINELLGKVPGVMGVKTGWTENARENLVTYIERDGHKVMIAILGSQDRFGETEELINWIFGNYTWEEVNPSSRSNQS